MLSLAPISRGQSTPPAPADPFETGWNVGINAGISTLSNQQTNNGFTMSTALRVAQHWNVRFDTYILNNPAVTVVLVSPEYRLSLSHLLKSSPTFAVNANRLELFINAGAGTAKSSADMTAAGPVDTTKENYKLAYSIGTGFDIKLTDTMSIRPLDIKYVRASILNNGNAFLGNHLQFAAGLGVHF
jgi:opacity protein-like surface antigen